MSDTALMGRFNLPHNLPTFIEAAKNRLTDLATLDLATEVAGQSRLDWTPSAATSTASSPSITSSTAMTGRPNGSSR